MRQTANDLGIALPDTVDLIATGAAGGVILVAVAAAWLAGRYLGPRLADLGVRFAGERAHGIGPRLCRLVRYLFAWMIVALGLGLYGWPPLATLLLGLVAASAAALLALTIVRGLQLPRWIAASLAAFVFVVTLADAVGGLAEISGALDDVGLTVGTRRISLLDVVQLAFALLALYTVVRIANGLIGQSIKRARGLDPTQQLLAQKLAAIAIIVVAFFVGIDLVGIDLTALAVFGGALGLAVGFGLQKTVGNLFAGIILLMDRSIKPGDVISVGESFGSVSKIGVRAVSIVTRDGKEYLIPNEILMTEEVVNWSYSTRDVRVSIPVGIAYGCDIRLAQRLMGEAATACSRVLRSPKPVVWMIGFGDSAIDHEIRVWIRDPEAGLGSVRSEILGRVLDLFDANGIAIPFPQRDVHVKDWPKAPAEPPAEPEEG